MMLALSLHGWSDIAQLVIAIAATLALIGAILQVRLGHTNARRARVYEYADRFNDSDLLRISAEYKRYWENHTYAEFNALKDTMQAERLMLPNLIEEVAFLYNRKLLDRDIAAELLGIYIERLWKVSIPLVSEARRREDRPDLFSEWQEMQADTPSRKERAIRKSERRRARRRLFRGT